MSRPTLAEVRSVRAPVVGEGAPGKIQSLWGPISEEEARRAGASFPTSSVLFRPAVPEEIRAAALEVVPTDVLPRQGETIRGFVQRLAESSFLNDSHVLKDGQGPRRVRLNGKSYPQPRRVDWSVVVKDERVDDDGDDVITLLNYTAYGREPTDWESHVMPRPVYDLGYILWRESWPLLTELCKKHPPPACQLLLYYVMFGGCMGRHRDNYNSSHFDAVASGEKCVAELHDGNHHGGDANSQLVGKS